MRIAIIVEGSTEIAFKEPLNNFLSHRIRGQMPKLQFIPQGGRVPKSEKLNRLVTNLLRNHDHVIALTDVYTGTNDFKDASDAKDQMRDWVDEKERFHPHAAQHDFEAWLLPYWAQIQKFSGSNQKMWNINPEKVNHGNPPAHRLKDLFEIKKNSYVKPRDAKRILKDQDLTIAADACPELKSFLNTILTVCGGAPLT